MWLRCSGTDQLCCSEETQPPPYLWLSACVVQDGHGVRIGNSMTYQSGPKHPGQVSHIHLSVDALRDPWGETDTILTHL